MPGLWEEYVGFDIRAKDVLLIISAIEEEGELSIGVIFYQSLEDLYGKPPYSLNSARQ